MQVINTVDDQVTDTVDERIRENSKRLFNEANHKICVGNDRVFSVLLILQWIAAIGVALIISPRTWIGEQNLVHIHVYAAVIIGFLLTVVPIYFNLKQEGAVHNRYINVIAQGLYSVLLIHLTGGRIETHFHVFGSLAFFAFYRDLRVLLVGTLIVTVDHFIRGIFIPQSVFGILTGSDWRWLEHAGWVIFEDVFLGWTIIKWTIEARAVAQGRAELMEQHAVAEQLVQVRTSELQIERNELHEKNETIAVIYSNVISGFFLIDDSLHVQSGFTISCINLLGPEMKEGQALGKVLQLNERNAAHFQIMVEQVFEDFLPEEVSLSQIPRRLIIDDRAVKIEGSVVRSADKKVKNILFTIYDITEMEKIEQQNATNYCLIKILQQKDSFCQFVINTKENLEECLVPENRKEQNHLRSMLHSIKGNSSVFGMEDLAALIHQIEEKSSIDLLDVKLVEDHFKNFLGKHFEILNTFYESIAVETYTVSRSQVEKLENSFVTSIVSQQVKDEAFKWLDEIKLKPAKDYFNPFIKMGMSMAERLAKKVDVHLLTPEYLMDGDLLKPIVQNITHLIRNSIDHGIEPFHLRGAKNEKGFVAISVEKTKTHWIVRVTDDGRGVDIKTVCEVAVIKKLINPIDIEKMSDQKKLDLIFLSGVSTSSAVSQFSGRGIGMAAMFEAVKQVSGNIKIISEHGKGTTIVIFVPLKTNYLSDKKDALSSAS